MRATTSSTIDQDEDRLKGDEEMNSEDSEETCHRFPPPRRRMNKVDVDHKTAKTNGGLGQSLLFLWLLLHLFGASSYADTSTVPKSESCPDRCNCISMDDSSISVRCRNVSDLTLLFNSLSGRLVDRLQVDGCASPQPMLPPLPDLPRLRLIDISGCAVESVSPKTWLRVASTLREILLPRNAFKQMPLFGRLPVLRSLNLRANQLTDIVEGALETLPELRHLRLDDNRICELSSSAPNVTKSRLELLDLSGNCLSQVPAQWLRSSLKLRYLDLSGNKITEVANFQLMNLPNLEELRLNSNGLIRIGAMALMNVPKLRVLQLKHNELAHVDSVRLQAFDSLESVDLSHNRLGRLPNLRELKKLTYARLANNRISRIDTLAFSANPKLQLIDLTSNGITQIARNSFDGLDAMRILLLANNSIARLERGQLDGLRFLQSLSLRNNSLRSVESAEWSPLKQLTTLDLSGNRIENIGPAAFAGLQKLFWLDLADNKIGTLKPSAFPPTGIANIILHGNPLICDVEILPFVAFLVDTKVRTFLPSQPEVVCTAPPTAAGRRFKELMMRHANATMHAELAEKRRLATARPSVILAAPNGDGVIQTIPIDSRQPQIPQLNGRGMALSQETVRRLLSGQVTTAEVQALQSALPGFVVQLPGLGRVDISKMDPNLVAHVLRGGQIPGVPRALLDQIVSQYASALATQLSSGNMQENGMRATTKQLQLHPLKETTSSSVPPGQDPPQIASVLSLLPVSGNFTLNAVTLELLQLLPPNYDLTKLPIEVLQAVSKGELPPIAKLPQDLQDYLKNNSERFLSVLVKSNSNMTIEELLAKLPKMERPRDNGEMSFSPYDINHLSNDLIHQQEKERRERQIELYMSICLALVGILSVVAIILMGFHMRRTRDRRAAEAVVASAVTPTTFEDGSTGFGGPAAWATDSPTKFDSTSSSSSSSSSSSRRHQNEATPTPPPRPLHFV